MNMKLPGIVRVGYVRCDMLQPNIAEKARAGVPVAVGTDLQYVDIDGEGVINADSAYKNHGEEETATLEFHTTDSVPTLGHFAWLAESVNGESWLIGAKEGPFPRVEVHTETGTSGGNRAGYSVKVTLKSIKALVRIGRLVFC